MTEDIVFLKHNTSYERKCIVLFEIKFDSTAKSRIPSLLLAFEVHS